MKNPYDGYEVGRRILKIAPVWILLCAAAFVLAYLFFGWMARPLRKPDTFSEEVYKNEALNRTKPEAQTPEARTSSAAVKPTSDNSESTESSKASGEAPAQVAANSNAAAENEIFSVQVGAWGDLSQANEQVSRLRAGGFDARVVESDAAIRFRYLVRSGSFAAREEALKLAAQLRAKKLADETVIVEPARP